MQWDFKNKIESSWTGKSSFVLEVELFASLHNLFRTLWSIDQLWRLYYPAGWPPCGKVSYKEFQIIVFPACENQEPLCGKCERKPHITSFLHKYAWFAIGDFYKLWRNYHKEHASY